MYSSKLKGISNVSCCFLPYTAMLVIFFGSFNHFHIYALHFCSTFYLWVFLIFTSLMIIDTVWGYRAHCRHHTLNFLLSLALWVTFKPSSLCWNISISLRLWLSKSSCHLPILLTDCSSTVVIWYPVMPEWNSFTFLNTTVQFLDFLPQISFLFMTLIHLTSWKPFLHPQSHSQ